MLSLFHHKDAKIHSSDRLTAIDALRGLLMVLMALDHASYAYNAGRFTRDSAAMWTPGTEIPTVQFLFRALPHFGAPTFIFLAGFVLALSMAKRRAAGVSERAIDAFMLKRGLFILLLDPLWMSFGYGTSLLFQVMYAIGASFRCMAGLRRLDYRLLLIIGLAVILFDEAFAGLVLWAGDGKPGLLGALLVTGGSIMGKAFVLYPLLPWLAFMILGWACGQYLLHTRDTFPIGLLVKVGLGSLIVFLVVRGINGYGNMALLRDNLALVQWLHTSKYPPSISFSAYAMGIMFLLLALLGAWYQKRPGSPVNPLLVFGRTPLFFYVIHVHLLTGSAHLFGIYKTGGLIEAIVAALLVMIILYPLCRWYGNTKKSHPGSFLRYV
jgi:uncharacterized membrane protein